MKVFLTGASSGLGEALARHYSRAGASVALVARRREPLERLRRELAGPVDIHVADVRDPDAMQRAAGAFLERHGAPDLVIGNAGISHGNLTQAPEDLQAFRDILDVNVLGLVNTFQPFVEPMRARGRGRLVGIASVAGFRGLPGATAYSASKAAAIRYLEGLRVELHGSGVGVTTICPGYVKTPMTEGNPYPMPFLIEADDAARRFARAIGAGRRFVVIPWQMAIVGRLLLALPDGIYDRIASRFGRKPRRPPAP